jgi:protein-disulfide isomerase
VQKQSAMRDTEFDMRPTIRLAASLIIGALTVIPASAQTPSPEQRKVIESVVREYILANPEVVQEALVELERRQQDTQRSAQKKAVKDESATLLNSPRHAVVGNPDGDVTIVEFMDYNCGYCKRSLGDLAAMIKADPKLRVVLKDFPVLGPDSVEASQIAIAAKNQLKGEKYWAFHAKLMETRGRVGKDRALAVAKESGADMDKLTKDLQSPEIRAAIAENVSLGDKLGLTGTPAYVIGDEIVFGAVGRAALVKTVTAFRQCGKAVC